MAFSKYFSKNLLAINTLLKTNQSLLYEKLNNFIVSVAFDENAVSTKEGQNGLELIVRLLSRLYPKIKIIDLSNNNSDMIRKLSVLAVNINSQIELITEDSEVDVYIVAGSTNNIAISNGYIIYFGSDKWNAKYSTTKTQSFGNSSNPFGCGIAACLVASNVFRYLFKESLRFIELDSELEFSVFSLSAETKNINPEIEGLNFIDVTLVGIGAIGNSTVWALSKIESLSGTLHLVDDETVSLSNLQRYILLAEENEGDIKVEVAKKFFQQEQLDVLAFKGNWTEYVNNQNHRKIECVGVCIDNDKDRIGIQSSLPHFIYNAFTEKDSIGVNRHLSFGIEPCLACSYIPLYKKKSYLTEVAENCNIPDKYEMIKDYFNLGKSVDDIWLPKYNRSLLEVIAEANNLVLSNLSQYTGMMINQFYADVVCGGILLALKQSDNKIENIDAPLAFQSSFAGILLAAEIVRHHLKEKIDLEHRTDFYPLNSISENVNPYNRVLIKDNTGRCICHDTDFVESFNEKWNV